MRLRTLPDIGGGFATAGVRSRTAQEKDMLHILQQGLIKEDFTDMGRTKAERLIKRDSRVTVRFTETEYGLIAERAAQSKSTIATYLHDIALNRSPEIRYQLSPPSAEIAGLAASLGKSGSNLNQIARYFHDGGADTEGIRTAILKCVNAIFSMRKDLKQITADYRR